MRRSKQRRAAIFALYQHDLTGRDLDEIFDSNALPFTRSLARMTLTHRDEVDQIIRRYAVKWELERIAPLERSILRAALLEMLHPDLLESDVPIPAEGAIDEAVEIAKEFCSAEAPAFINGILGSALREIRDNNGDRDDEQR